MLQCVYEMQRVELVYTQTKCNSLCMYQRALESIGSILAPYDPRQEFQVRSPSRT